MIEVGVGALPLRARLLHVGLAKTGTTAIQRAASERRRLLLEHGVRYPGTRYNHRQSAMALMRRPEDHAAVPDDAWSTLMTEVEHDTDRRIMISNEFIAEWPAPIAGRFLRELGERAHVVITVRGFAEILPSIWQQTIKTGSSEALEPWLRTVLAEDRTTVPASFARHDQAATVRRWVALAGSEHVTVIIGSRDRPRLVEESFEQLLGLPPTTLETSGHRGFDANRSLGPDEAALVLRVNQLAAPYGVERSDLVRVLRNGALRRVLDHHEPTGRLGLPGWADRRAAEIGRGYAEAIVASGARVLGDLDALGRSGDRSGRPELPRTIDVDLAAQALLGALLASRTPGTTPSVEPTKITTEPARPARRRADLQATLRKRLRPLLRITKS